MKPTEEQILAVFPRAIEILEAFEEPTTTRSIRAQVRLLIRHHYTSLTLRGSEYAHAVLELNKAIDRAG